MPEKNGSIVLYTNNTDSIKKKKEEDEVSLQSTSENVAASDHIAKTLDGKVLVAVIEGLKDETKKCCYRTVTSDPSSAEQIRMAVLSIAFLQKGEASNVLSLMKAKVEEIKANRNQSKVNGGQK